MTNRRDFVKTSLVAGSALGLGGIGLHARDVAAATPRVERAPRALRILILGGTGFTGPHQIRYAIERGHHVTVFNRGRRQPDLPDGVEHLQGDRNLPDGAGVASLKAEVAKGTKWDVVIDNPTTLPFWVRDAAEALRSAASHYIFISTISVYGDTSVRGMDESTAVLPYEGPDAMKETQQSAGRLYGQLKAVSEKEAEKWFPGRTTVIRPGLIVGPGDTSGRFTYWPVRLEKGGEVLAPGDGHDAAQFVDARDLAEWTIRMAENRTFGTFNATGPAGELSTAEMLGGIRAAFDGTNPTRLIWVPADFLQQHQVRAFGSDMTVWIPPTPDNGGFMRVSVAKALAAGLTYRPLAVTAKDTADWYRSLKVGDPAFPGLDETMIARWGGTMTAEREKAVIDAWKARPGA